MSDTPSPTLGSHWYEKWPERLQREEFEFRTRRPSFTLSKEAGGELSWTGDVRSASGKSYTIKIVYPSDYPYKPPSVYPLSVKAAEISHSGRLGYHQYHMMADGSICISFPHFWTSHATAVVLADVAEYWLNGLECFVQTGQFDPVVRPDDQKVVPNQHHIDFSALHSDVPGEGLEALVRHLGEVLGLSVEWGGRGADDGKDLIFTKTQAGLFGEEKFRWLVQCKDYSSSGRSVSESDVGAVLEKIHQHKANGYLLVTTTAVSTGLKKMLDALDVRNNGPTRTCVWDGAELRKLLTQKAASLLEIYFPISVVKEAHLGRLDMSRLSHQLRTTVISIQQGLKAIETRILENSLRDDAVIRTLLLNCQVSANELSFYMTRIPGCDDYFDPQASFKLTHSFFESIERNAKEFAITASFPPPVLEMPNAKALEKVPELKISEHAFQTVVLELMRNAVHYNIDATSPIKVTVEQAHQQLRLSIENKGIRIMPGEEQNIFKYGFRGLQAARRSVRGMGVGLFLVGVIVRTHGGTVDLSQDGDLVRFSIAVPTTKN